MSQKTLVSWIFFLFSSHLLCEISLMEQFKKIGYAEICDTNHGSADFDSLYVCFDQFIEFLQKNPKFAQKLYCAKERFIRSKDRNYYSTDFFGFYDESPQLARSQISFYYATHFHQFIKTQYPEMCHILEIDNFLEKCFQIQKSYEQIFIQAAIALDLEKIFSLSDSHVPILFKVVKYLPSYIAQRPHYDGTAFSLFLDSTDDQSLLLAPYKTIFSVEDFFIPVRQFFRSNNQNSVLLIPGALLAEFLIDPTPHIVVQSGKTRYATIAFAMRPHYVFQKNNFSDLPNFRS